ncbi:MAG: MmcB family DNA repair protein, partial [Hyphomicrobiales bacterium]|nr:MmcB family DNA repair protein [Hyphomicrobiales bacterium]
MANDRSPLIPYADLLPLEDGRQSAAALEIRRGVGRLLRLRAFSVLPELTLASGRRADLVALGQKGEIWIVEIKSSLADLRA